MRETIAFYSRDLQPPAEKRDSEAKISNADLDKIASLLGYMVVDAFFTYYFNKATKLVYLDSKKYLQNTYLINLLISSKGLRF